MFEGIIKVFEPPQISSTPAIVEPTIPEIPESLVTIIRP